MILLISSALISMNLLLQNIFLQSLKLPFHAAVYDRAFHIQFYTPNKALIFDYSEDHVFFVRP